MSALQQALRSTVHARRDSHNVCGRAVESPRSITNRLHLRQSIHATRVNSVNEFGRRLARKASAFYLRSQSTRSQRALPAFVKQVEESRSTEAVTQVGISNSGTETPSTNRNLSGSPSGPLEPNKQTQKERGEYNCVSMSSTTSPPVSFPLLQEIATNACDSVFSGVSGYTHPATESWNTSIINTILSSLVKESTSASSPQPLYKFVVNSTIIQHAPSVSAEEGTGSGRRGMHSASGAYWNNEKDGMWSFKYEAAEGKGLDVVVGVIWIWIG